MVGLETKTRRQLRSALLNKIRTLTLFGETKTVKEWANDPRAEVTRYRMDERIREGWDIGDPAIIKAAGRDTCFNIRFEAELFTGQTLGYFKTIRQAEDAILRNADNGIIVDHIFRREIPVPRVKLPPTNPNRDRIWVTAWGETKTVLEWSRDPRCKVKTNTLYARLAPKKRKKNWKPEDAISTPADPILLSKLKDANSKTHTAFGLTLTAQEWAKHPLCKVSYSALRERFRLAWTVEDAVSIPATRGVPENKVFRLRGKKLPGFGECKTLKEWAQDERCEITRESLREKLRAGIPLEKALKRHSASPSKTYRAFGFELTVSEWAKHPRCEVTHRTLLIRLKEGWPIEQALKATKKTAPPGEVLHLKGKMLLAFGENKTLREWAQDTRCEISAHQLQAKIRNGIPLEEAMKRFVGGPRKGTPRSENYGRGKQPKKRPAPKPVQEVLRMLNSRSVLR